MGGAIWEEAKDSRRICHPTVTCHTCHTAMFSPVYVTKINECQTAQNSPMYVTPPSSFQCMSYSPEFSDLCRTTEFSKIYVTESRILQYMLHQPVFPNSVHHFSMYDRWNNIPHSGQDQPFARPWAIWGARPPYQGPSQPPVSEHVHYVYGEKLFFTGCFFFFGQQP